MTTTKTRQGSGKMRRVAEGIYERNGRYIVTIWNPEKGQTGGKDWHTLEPGAALKDARALRRRLQGEKASGRRAGGKDLTVADWAGRYDGETWVQGRWLIVRPRKAESTNIHNDARVRSFARVFAGRTLASITEEEAQVYVLEHVHSFKQVHAMYNDAMALRLVEHNPFAGLRVPTKEGRRGIVVLSDSELEQLSGIARAVHGSYGPLFAAMIETAAWTGLRSGELFLVALEPARTDAPEDRVNFVDLKAGVVHVDWQRTKTGKITRPKKESQREVVLLPGAEDALRSIRSWDSGRPVFTTKRGNAFTQRTHFYYWDPVRAAFEVSLPAGHHLRKRTSEDGGENLDFYELRHFFGTKLAHPPAGVKAASPYEIAAMMGHKDGGQLAMERYIHVRAQEAQTSIRDAWRKAS